MENERKYTEEEKTIDFKIMAPLFKLLEPHINLLINERLNEIINNSIPQAIRFKED